MPFRPADAFLPLTPADFEILLALADAPLHGYAIYLHVEARAGAVLPLRTGTVYRALARLVGSGLVEAGPERDRRRLYAITTTGREVARAEAERLASQVQAARLRHVLPEGSE
jgi:DNA-binding PadR family transcriptional regulator